MWKIKCQHSKNKIIWGVPLKWPCWQDFIPWNNTLMVVLFITERKEGQGRGRQGGRERRKESPLWFWFLFFYKYRSKIQERFCRNLGSVTDCMCPKWLYQAMYPTPNILFSLWHRHLSHQEWGLCSFLWNLGGGSWQIQPMEYNGSDANVNSKPSS